MSEYVNLIIYFLKTSLFKAVENAATQDHFSKVSIYNFLGLKHMKKGYMEMTKKNYLETFEKCPGSLHFPLLFSVCYRCG